MCEEFEREDTDEIDPLKAILEELQKLVCETKDLAVRIEGLEGRIEGLEGRVEQVVTDLHTVHQFQQGYAERLGIIEKSMVNIPLRSTPVPRKPDGDDRVKP